MLLITSRMKSCGWLERYSRALGQIKMSKQAMCGTKVWNGSGRYQSRLINGVRTFSGRVPYLESNEHDNPTGQPVSMADLGESIHESSGPSRNCPELRIHLATGARTGRERGDHRASVSHDRRSVQALLCQPSASGSHFPERAIYPTDIVACHLLSAQPERRGEVCWQLHVCELHALQRRREIVAFDGAA
jgi:hypothetical protein